MVLGLKSLETIYFIRVSALFDNLKIMDYTTSEDVKKQIHLHCGKKYLKIMKRVQITENQYDNVLKKFQVDDGDIKTIENNRLEMGIVDTKQKSRELITKAFRLGIKYHALRKDLYARKEIKKKLDDMIKVLDDDKR